MLGMKVSEGRMAVMSAASRMDIGGYPVSSEIGKLNKKNWILAIPSINDIIC